ncbi:MAG: TonB-dependent receptor [Tissierellales bacterium]
MKKIKWTKKAMLVGLAFSTAVGHQAVYAQNTGPALEEIVVTAARRREEPVQSVPVAVSVIPAEQIEKLHASNITALSSQVPNLFVGNVAVSPGVPSINLRGFGTRTSDIAAEPGVPVYIDGVYQTIITGSLADLFDLESLEVLRGPQGTLLGKNASAGAILLNRTRPTGELGGKLQLEYGSHDLAQIQGLVNFPIIENVLAGKIYASYRERDDYIKNYEADDMGAEERSALRGALLFTPTDDLSIYFTVDELRDRSSQVAVRNVSDQDQLGCVFFDVCAPHEGKKLVTNSQYTDKPEVDENNVTLNVDWALGGVELTSITGYRNYEQINRTDLDSSPLPILEIHGSRAKMEQFSEELRLSSVENGGFDLDGRLSWLLAGYYGTSRATMDQPMMAFGAIQNEYQRVERENKAIFGQLDYELIENLTLSFGTRRSWDDVTHDYSLPHPGEARPALAFTHDNSFNDTSIEAGARYEFNDDKMVYIRYAEGYRGGGFVGFPANHDAAVGFSPETSESWEVGTKTDWIDGRLRLNLTVFQTKFEDMQREIVSPGPNNTFIQVTANAAAATTEGVELEAVIQPVDQWSLNVNVGYLDASYDSFISFDQLGNQIDLSNQPLTNASEWTISVASDYRVNFANNLAGFDGINLVARASYRSELEFSSTLDPVGSQGGYSLVDLSAALTGERYNLTFYINNVFDKEYLLQGENIGGLVQYRTDNLGRTAGVILSVNF